MPTRNNDSSYITQRRQAMALSAFNNQLQAAQNAGTSVRMEQSKSATLDVITLRRQGVCFCSDIQNGNVYNNNAPGSCGCRS